MMYSGVVMFKVTLSQVGTWCLGVITGATTNLFVLVPISPRSPRVVLHYIGMFAIMENVIMVYVETGLSINALHNTIDVPIHYGHS